MCESSSGDFYEASCSSRHISLVILVKLSWKYISLVFSNLFAIFCSSESTYFEITHYRFLESSKSSIPCMATYVFFICLSAMFWEDIFRFPLVQTCVFEILKFSILGMFSTYNLSSKSIPQMFLKQSVQTICKTTS